MDTIHFRVGITFDDDATKKMGEVLQQIMSLISTETSSQKMPERPLFDSEKLSEVKQQQLLIGSRDVAKLLSISERTLWGMQNSGRIPKPVRIGRSVRWSVEELKSWIQKGCPARR